MNIIKDITTPIKTFLLDGLAIFIIASFALTGSIQADKVDNSVTQSIISSNSSDFKFQPSYLTIKSYRGRLD